MVLPNHSLFFGDLPVVCLGFANERGKSFRLDKWESDVCVTCLEWGS